MGVKYFIPRMGTSISYCYKCKYAEYNDCYNKIRVAYRLPTKYGSIYGNRRIEEIYDGLIKFKGIRYPYKLCNFTYLEIIHKYKTKIREIDLRYVRFTND